jgi:signal transduction histidine kinase
VPILRKAPLRLLIIDDSADDACFLIEDLEKGGYSPEALRVDDSAGLEEALRNESWDLAVCDYRMPGFDGGRALDLVKKLKPDLPFVFWSGTLPLELTSLISRADGFISKDHPKKLIGMLDRVLGSAARKKLAAPVEPAPLCLPPITPSAEDLETFTHTACHDLRAPIRAIRAFTNLVIEDYSGRTLDGAAVEQLGRVIASCDKLEALVLGLRSYVSASFSEIRPQSTSLDLIAREVLQAMGPDLTRRKAEVAVGDSLGKVQADPAALRAAVTQLMLNAITFVKPGMPPKVRLSSESRGGSRRLWVEDCGPGISDEDRALLFRPFDRLDGGQPGAGLGLAMVRRLAERMGGRCDVESVEGRGSRFWIEIPGSD